MTIKLDIDFSEKIIGLPDGYVRNLKTLRLDFFDWIYDQDEYITEFGGYEYDENAFVRFLNEVVLADSIEKAGVLRDGEDPGKIFGTISF